MMEIFVCLSINKHRWPKKGMLLRGQSNFNFNEDHQGIRVLSIAAIKVDYHLSRGDGEKNGCKGQKISLARQFGLKESEQATKHK